MNKTEAIIAASALTVVVLGTKLAIRNRQLNQLRSQARNLTEWSKIAQAVLVETWTADPELVKKLSDDTRMKIDFYNIIAKENLY